MKKENIVSIWLAAFATEDKLLEYTTEKVESYSNDIKFLLKNCSYGNSIIQHLKNFQLDKKYNTVILIYDFQYDNSGGMTDLPIDFIISVSYKK